MGGSQEGMLELMVYALECAVYYIMDTCDTEDEFYEFTVKMFDSTIRLLTVIDQKLLMLFKLRLEALIKIARDDEYGYGDQIQALWRHAFGSDVLKISFNKKFDKISRRFSITYKA